MNKSMYYAQRDGLEYYRGPGRGSMTGSIWFKIKCEECGETYDSTVYYGDEKPNLCEPCKKGWKKKEKAKDKAYQQNLLDSVMTKAEQRFYKAVEKMRSQVKDFRAYEKAVKLAERRCESFGSQPEVMAAIELVKNGIRAIPQQPVRRYRVDFVLPDYKVILEIDGERYHERRLYPTNREAEIQLAFGMDWEIIHISAEKISKNFKCLLPEIRKIATTGKI